MVYTESKHYCSSKGGRSKLVDAKSEIFFFLLSEDRNSRFIDGFCLREGWCAAWSILGWSVRVSHATDVCVDFDASSDLLLLEVASDTLCLFTDCVELEICDSDSYKRLLFSDAEVVVHEEEGDVSCWMALGDIKSKLCNSTYNLSSWTSSSPTSEILEPNLAFLVRSKRFFLATWWRIIISNSASFTEDRLPETYCEARTVKTAISCSTWVVVCTVPMALSQVRAHGRFVEVFDEIWHLYAFTCSDNFFQNKIETKVRLI